MSSPNARDVTGFVPAMNFGQSLKFYEAVGMEGELAHCRRQLGSTSLELAGNRLYTRSIRRLAFWD